MCGVIVWHAHVSALHPASRECELCSGLGIDKGSVVTNY